MTAQVEQVVEQLSNQLRSTIKSQIKQIQSGNGVGGESRLGMSKFSSLTELHIAVANNQYEVAERLLANGADVDARSPAQMTPLHSAADGGYKDIANLLLAHNATIDALGPHGATPLHLAAHRGRSSTVELLLREGAPMDVITDESFSFTPLYMACDMGHTRVVQVPPRRERLHRDPRAQWRDGFACGCCGWARGRRARIARRGRGH